MKKGNKQSGQAIMELMVLLLSFVICFLGLLMIMGFSIANIEILLDAKFNAEALAQYSDFGAAGIIKDDFRDWQYTKYDLIEYPIPFLAKDMPVGQQNNLEPLKTELNNPNSSQPNGRYAFNDFSVINPIIAQNIPYEAPSLSYLAANLHKGKSSEFHDTNNALITDRRYFNRQKMYDAFERIIGTDLDHIDLEDNYSNTVFFPAMKVLDKMGGQNGAATGPIRL